MAEQISIDYSQLTNFQEALERAPRELLRAMGKAYYRIGRLDIEKMKSEQLSGSGGLNVRSRGLKNSFKFKATDSRRATTFRQLFLTEYTGWKAAKIFQTGGTVAPSKSRALMIAARFNAGGKKKYSTAQIKAMLANKEAKIIYTARGPMIIKERGGLTKKGNFKVGSRTEVIAFLRPRARQQKRLNFYENFQSNSGQHDEILYAAVEEALQAIAKNKKVG